MKEKIQKLLQEYFPVATPQQLEEMTKITLFHLEENSKTLAKKNCH